MTDVAMPKGKALPSDKPYTGDRRDVAAARKIAERMAKARPLSAVKAHAKRMKKLAAVSYVGQHNDHSAPNCGPGKVSDIAFAEGKRRSADDKIARQTLSLHKEGEWRHGPNGPVFVSLEGWASPDQGERRSGEIVGKIRHTPVGAKTANARPDSPFKRAKGATVVVVVKK